MVPRRNILSRPDLDADPSRRSYLVTLQTGPTPARASSRSCTRGSAGPRSTRRGPWLFQLPPRAPPPSLIFMCSHPYRVGNAARPLVVPASPMKALGSLVGRPPRDLAAPALGKRLQNRHPEVGAGTRRRGRHLRRGIPGVAGGTHNGRSTPGRCRAGTTVESPRRHDGGG